MERVAFVGDVHLDNHRRAGGAWSAGTNERCKYVQVALRDACGVAAEQGARRIVVLGDLFDTARPSPGVIAAAFDALTSTNITVELLCGNHDRHSDAPGDHALSPLAYASNVRVRECAQMVTIEDGFELWMVPYQSGEAAVYLPTMVGMIAQEAGEARTRVLAVHMGIRDETTAPWLQGAHDAIGLSQLADLCVQYGITHVCAGNWHNRKTWQVLGRRIVQVGALAPTGWDNEGEDYGHVEIIDQGGHGAVTVGGPRFFTVRTEEQLLARLDREPRDAVFVRWIISGVRNLFDANVRIGELIKAGAIAGGFAEQEHTAAVHEAEAVRYAHTDAAQAVVEYVRDMKLPDGVVGSEVAKSAALYLSRGGA